MDSTARLLSDLSSWYWWMSVVVIGLLINLASAYLKPHIDRRYARLLDRSAAKRMERERRYREDVDLASADPRQLVLQGFQEIRMRVLSVFFLAGSLIIVLLLVLLPSVLPEVSALPKAARVALNLLGLFGGLMSVILSWWCHQNASRAHDVLHEAQKRFVHGSGSEAHPGAA